MADEKQSPPPAPPSNQPTTHGEGKPTTPPNQGITKGGGK